MRKVFSLLSHYKNHSKKTVSSRNAEDSVHKSTKSAKEKTSDDTSSAPSVEIEAFQLDSITDSFRPFCSCPTLDKSYFAWLTKVEKKKA